MRTLEGASEAPELSYHRDHDHPPYEAGNVIKLKLFPTQAAVQEPQFVNAKILKCFTPFTMSQVMVVRVQCPEWELEGEFVMKLYDRRLMVDARNDAQMHQWSPKIEKKYRKYIFDESHSKFYRRLRMVDERHGYNDDIDRWPEMDQETYIHFLCNIMHTSELEAYRRVWLVPQKDKRKELRHRWLTHGTDAPRVIGRVEFAMDGSCHQTSLTSYSPLPEDNLDIVPGLLLENVSRAFSLEDMYLADPPPPAPRETWQYICQDACDIVRKMMQRLIFNHDVDPRNTLVRWDPILGKYKAMMIDFGHCKFRQPWESLYDWRCRQANADEEGAIGSTMELYLQETHGGGFVYKESEYTKRLMDDFMGPGGPRPELRFAEDNCCHDDWS